MYTRVISFDPGSVVGCAVFEQHELTKFCGVSIKDEAEFVQFVKSLYDEKISTGIVIEHIHSMPNDGVASTHSFGYSYGFLCGVVSSVFGKYESIDPKIWKKRLGFPKGLSRNDAKRLSVSAVMDTFGIKLKAKEHDVADAILINCAVRGYPHKLNFYESMKKIQEKKDDAEKRTRSKQKD